MKKMNILKNECLNDIVIIDGMTRSGKFYLGKLISGIKDMEYFISSANIDGILALNIAGTLNDADATSLLVNSMNKEIYHLAIGRDLNMRHDDGSSILNSFEKGLYIDRQNKGLDGYDGLKKITDNRLSVFILHQSLQLLGIVKGAAPKSKIINIRRHPIDLAYSWIKRGWGHRYGKDSLSFQPVYMHNGNPVPYFAVKWAEEYLACNNEYDRVVKSIVHITESESCVIENNKYNIHCAYYDNLIEQPNKEMIKICNFLKRSPHESMYETIDKERIDIDFLAQRSEKMEYLRRGIEDDVFFDRLLTLSKKYEKNLKESNI